MNIILVELDLLLFNHCPNRLLFYESDKNPVRLSFRGQQNTWLGCWPFLNGQPVNRPGYCSAIEVLSTHPGYPPYGSL